MVAFVRTLQDAHGIVEELRSRIPDRLRPLRAIEFRHALLDGVTLVPLPGAGVEDLATACDFALRELGVPVTLKLRPTVLGLDRCEALLHDTLGYRDVEVDAAL